MTDQVEQDVELDEVIDENEIVEAQAHDPKNAEAQSIASVDKADDSVGKAAPPALGTAKNATKQDPMPKTKAALMAGMMAKLQGMNKQQLQAMYKAEGFESDEDEAAIVESEHDFSEDLNALVESEATLSDEFKGKAAIIFEAAITSKVSEEVDRLEESYREELAEEIARTKEDLVDKVDGYLNYVVENWMEENKLAIQSGLRTEIAEGFMGKLKDLFTESYIEVPESKVDLVDGLAEQVEELEGKLNEQTGKFIEMSEELDLYKRYEVIREASRGLAQTEVEKLTSLVKDIEFVDEDAFAEKVAIVKESYFKKEKSATSIIESEETDEETQEVSDTMALYLNAIRQASK
jgi:hypothetical protein